MSPSSVAALVVSAAIASGQTAVPRESGAPPADPPSPAAGPPPSSMVPPGGYWRPGEARDPEPADGQDKLIAAYVLIPLGTLATASGAAATWLSTPGHCTDRWARLGAEPDAGQCKGLYILNAIRTSYGALMLGSGIVLLGIGLHQRKTWRRWKQRGGVSMWWGRDGAGVGVRWSF